MSESRRLPRAADMTDPAIVRTPAGEAVDGRRLLAQSVAFGRALRGAGLGIDLGAAVDFATALTLVDETLGVVLKYEEDIRQVRGERTRQYLAEVAARG